MLRHTRACLALAFCLTAACSAEPQGQVVATIDGAEVTRRELNAELEAAGVADGIRGGEAARAAALERVIDRKLLARAGKSALIDRLPGFQAAALARREDLLARMLVQRAVDALPPPTAAEVAARIAAQPWRYGKREALLVEQADAGARPSLRVLDSAGLLPETARRLAGVAPGGRVMLEGARETITVRNRWDIAMAPEEQAVQAEADLNQERALRAQQSLLGALRARARIERQPAGAEAR